MLVIMSSIWSALIITGFFSILGGNVLFNVFSAKSHLMGVINCYYL